jgi:hypothetical protein
VAKLTEGVMISALRETGRVLALHKDTNSKVMISIYFAVIRIFNCGVVSYLHIILHRRSQNFGLGGGQQKPRWGQKISGPHHFKSPPSTTFLVKMFPDNNIIIAFVAFFPISVFSMLRHEDSSMSSTFEFTI